MQNKTLSLLTVLCLSTAMVVLPAMAQDAPVKAPESPALAPAPDAVNVPANVANVPGGQVPSVAAPQPSGARDNNSSKESEKMRLEAELNNTTLNSAEILDFPARTSLGEMEMATLPGIKESLITGPAPMAPSVSPKDLPSEQLLGRITSEVFQEMADLERGNVFLRLQMQKEQLKNDLERLKATYRQTRLEEIAKREEVVRSRIKWWEEQENIRLDMEKKKAETEAVEQQIAEAEELRNKLRSEAVSGKDGEAAESAPVSEVPVKEQDSTADRGYRSLASLYTLQSVRGVKSNLSARVRKTSDGTYTTVKADEMLGDLRVVSVTKDALTTENPKGIRETILLKVISASDEAEGDE